MLLNVQKLDIALTKVQQCLATLNIRTIQTTTTTKAAAWGVRFKQKKIETVFEPINENPDERK